MASKKSLKDLKEEQKKLSDLIRKKQKETEEKALRKMGESYIKHLTKLGDKDRVNKHISDVGLTADELSVVRENYKKVKAKTSSPTAQMESNSHTYN